MPEIQENITEEEIADINKAMFQLQGAITSLMQPLKLYGQTIYVDAVIIEICKLAFHLHYRIEGLDAPFEWEEIHW